MSNKATQHTHLLYKQTGQSLIEVLLLAIMLGAIWWLPITVNDQTLLELLRQIAADTAAHFHWIWTRFLLNPMVAAEGVLCVLRG